MREPEFSFLGEDKSDVYRRVRNENQKYGLKQLCSSL